MYIRCALLGLAALVLSSSPVFGQDPSAGRSSYRSRAERAGRLRNSPKLLLGVTSKKSSLGTFDTNRTMGMMTRSDQLRLMVAKKRQYGEKAPTFWIPPSPIKNMLERRNLLTARSPLAKTSTATIGRNDYAVDDQGRRKGDLSRIEGLVSGAPAPDINQPDDGQFQDSLATRSAKRAEEYYNLGKREFRDRRFDRARDYFELVKSAQADSPRGYLGVFLTAVHTNDLMISSLNLLRAIDRAKSLDDLRMVKEDFYSDLEAFNRTREMMALAADAYPNNPAPNLLHAYLAWWNGDLSSAVEASQRVQKNTKEKVPAITRFVEMLATAKDGAGKAGPTSRP